VFCNVAYMARCITADSSGRDLHLIVSEFSQSTGISSYCSDPQRRLLFLQGFIQYNFLMDSIRNY
jgi:hypothetical protein